LNNHSSLPCIERACAQLFILGDFQSQFNFITMDFLEMLLTYFVLLNIIVHSTFSQSVICSFFLGDPFVHEQSNIWCISRWFFTTKINWVLFFILFFPIGLFLWTWHETTNTNVLVLENGSKLNVLCDVHIIYSIVLDLDHWIKSKVVANWSWKSFYILVFCLHLDCSIGMVLIWSLC
jgi:hypothetical protein